MDVKTLRAKLGSRYKAEVYLPDHALDSIVKTVVGGCLRSASAGREAARNYAGYGGVAATRSTPTIDKDSPTIRHSIMDQR